jgi:hypothetical protein
VFDPSVPIEAVFTAFGEPAIVQETVPRPIRVFRRSPDDFAVVNGREIMSTAVILEVRAADLGAIASGTRIVVAGETRLVHGAPEFLDPLRQVAVLNTIPDAP